MAVTAGTWGGLFGLDLGLTERFAPWLGVNPLQPKIVQAGENTMKSTPQKGTIIPQDYGLGNVISNGPLISNQTTGNGSNGTNPVVKTTQGGGTPPPADQGFVNVGTIRNGQRWTGVQWENLGGSGGANDANAKLMQEIDDMFKVGSGILDTQEARLRPENEADIANLTGRVDLNKTTATNEGNQLQSDITDQEKKQYGVIENAYQQAIRAKNSLTQQIMSRYGLGSSTGGAVSDLASQEFYRQMGGLNEQKVNVGDQVMKEIGKVKLFTKGKLDELDQYKNTAVDALKKDLAYRLNTIATARADINTNKAQMRLSAIQDTISSAREIANQATTFRQTIATNAINQIQTTMGRSLTPNEIKAVMTDYGIEGFGTIGSNTTASVNPNFYGKSKTNDEELQGLMGQK